MLRASSLCAMVMLLACGGPAPSAPRPAPAPSSAPSSPAAFAIVLGARTVIVPVDPAREVVDVSGRWVLDETVSPPRVVWDGDDAWDLPECACACAACSGPREVDAETGRLAASEHPCRCSVGPHSAACEVSDEAPAADENDCGTGEGEAHGALTFGALTVVSWWQEGCEGVNYYDGSSEDTPLVARPWTIEPPEDAEVLCAWDGVMHDSLARTESIDEPTCRREGERWEPLGEHGECSGCDERSEQALVRVRRGRMLQLAGRVDGPGGGALWQASWPATPDQCSAIDPCGDPSAFAAVRSAAEWWIASDGSAALGLEPEEASIYRPHEREPVRRSEVAIPELRFGDEGILAVFFHADASALLSAIDRAASLRSSRPAMSSAACESDEDCAVTHGCTHFCRAGACHPASDAQCAPSDATEPGMRCVERALVPLPLDPNDAAVEGPRASSTLGNRCVEHLRRGALDLAEAACARALSLADRASTRGALYYNLGRIEEARDETERARRYYERSLEERPDSDAVIDALEALDASEE